MPKKSKTLCVDDLRHAEYYGMQGTFDELYQKSQNGEVFENLMDLILSRDNILLAYRNIKANKGSYTAGTDKKNITDIGSQTPDDVVKRVRFIVTGSEHGYRPKPVRRKDIPKPNGKTRPLGIPCIWDRLIQQCIKQIMEPICEAKFCNNSYGFRPNRSVEHAINRTYTMLQMMNLHYVIEFDIKGFFDHINHDWMMRFLEWHIQDPNLLWLIKKYLKAGIMEDGKFESTEEGSAQGSVMSPMLANIYMHNVLTLWFKFVVKKTLKGDCFLVNFADDFVAGFQYKSEAEWYYSALKERMEQFNLELESSKSRLIEFGRFAETNRLSRGIGKPEAFDFLGFTFYCGKTRKGTFALKLQTSRKKFERKLKEYKLWIYDNRNRPVREIIKELNVKLVGHYRYYGVTWNYRRLCAFLHRVQQFLFKAVNRRGCRRAYTWGGFWEMLKCYPLAKPKTYYCLY